MKWTDDLQKSLLIKIFSFTCCKKNMNFQYLKKTPLIYLTVTIISLLLIFRSSIFLFHEHSFFNRWWKLKLTISLFLCGSQGHGSPKWPKYEKKCLVQTPYFLKRVYPRVSKWQNENVSYLSKGINSRNFLFWGWVNNKIQNFKKKKM